MKTVQPVGPYARGARGYWEHGWTPIPLPSNKKYPPESGWTGGSKLNSGEAISQSQLNTWINQRGDGNICLRAPKNVIGLDVDMYGSKTGGQTFENAIEEWGELPDTWISTSRNDGSGIRWFRIPEGLSWPGELPQGKGVETIKWDHRYGVVAPSIHPEGMEYIWISPEGQVTTEADGWEFPAIGDLPELPKAWVDGLTSGKKWTPREEADMDPQAVKDWLTDRGDDPMCPVMERTLQKWLQEIRLAGGDGGGHDSALKGIWALIGDSAAGHNGIRPALERMMAAFKEAVEARRGPDWIKEWRRAVADGVRKVAAEGEPDDEDICALSATVRDPKLRNRGSEGMDFERDDIGNGQRFALQWRDEIRWVPAAKAWYVWRERVWQPDTDGEAMRMATRTVRGMRAEAAFIEDAKDKAAFLKFVRSSSNRPRLNAMLDMAKDNKGMTQAAETFDINASQLVCSDGTVELPLEHSGKGVRRITSIQEHYNTIETGTAFKADARLAEWDDFLDRFQPDLEVREWLQRLAGYSLLGSNPRRLMVVAQGDTSTGKTTFAEAVSGALGGYAGSVNMTIFRDNQDEKPRPDLLRVMPKRFVYAEEASRSWHLHPDQIKRITGGAPIQARTLNSPVFLDAVPNFTPWLVTNAPPTIEGADAALWRRILVVPFDVQIPKSEEDARFRTRLASDSGRAAILAWLVAGYQAYLAAPERIQEIPIGAMPANARFRSEVSDLATCMEDIAEFGPSDDPHYRVAPDELYQAYRAWCELNGVTGRDVLSGTKFGREVSGEYPKKMVKLDGKPVRLRVGLRVRRGWVKALNG